MTPTQFAALITRLDDHRLTVLYRANLGKWEEARQSGDKAGIAAWGSVQRQIETEMDRRGLDVERVIGEVLGR